MQHVLQVLAAAMVILTRHALPAAVASVVCLAGGVAQAGMGYTTANNGGGAWTTPATWNPSGPPLPADYVMIDHTGIVSLTGATVIEACYMRKQGGSVDLGAFDLTAQRLDCGLNGDGGELKRSGAGKLTITGGGANVYLNNGGILNLLGGDSLFNLVGYAGGTGQTVNQLGTGGNVIYGGTVGVDNGLTYNLGANTLTALAGGGGGLNIGYGGGTGTFNRLPGSLLNVNQLRLKASTLELRPGDTIGWLQADQTSTVTQVGNVSDLSRHISLDNGSSYNLGGNNSLALTAMWAGRIDLGFVGGSGTFTRSAGSTVNADAMYINNSSSYQADAGDTFRLITTYSGSTATITDTVGGSIVTGLTVTQTLTLDGASVVSLTFNNPAVSGDIWAFRWSGNNVAALNAYIAAGRLSLVDNASFYDPSVFYDGTYTYIGAQNVLIPEPASGLLLALAGLAFRRRRGR